MRLIFGIKPGQSGKPVVDSHGFQSVMGALLDGDDMIVLIQDSMQNKSYVNRIINRFLPELYTSENIDSVSDDEAWSSYVQYFVEAGLLDPRAV